MIDISNHYLINNLNINNFIIKVSDNQYNEDLPDEMYGVNVAFPWSTKNYFVTPEERRKSIFTHLTRSNLADDYQSEHLYEKCFVYQS